jgi:alcohol dehydrogenase (cytochrome c)
MTFSRSVLATLIAAGAVATAMPAIAAPTTFDRLVNANTEPHNWLMHSQNYGNWRYSPLSQINKSNVDRLKMAFLFSIGRDTKADGQEEGTPLVEDGFMYVTNAWSKLMKVDVRSGDRGQPVWRFDPKSEFVRSNKGPALLGDNVYVTTNDVRLFAVNKNTGEVVWEKNMVSPTESNTQRSTPAPVMVKNLAIMGESTGGQSGTRSWVAAADATTGDLKWRFHTIPAPGEPGHETWKDDHQAWRTGGAGIWGQAAYDKDTNTLWMGTGDAFPTSIPEYRPGDNLYTASTIVLDADTGKLRWYFQEVPNEQQDQDTPNNRMLIDYTVGGKAMKIAANFTRGGFFLQHDRAGMTFYRGDAYQEGLNWTKGLDPKTGKPVEYNPNSAIQTYAVRGPRLAGGGAGLVFCPNQGDAPLYQAPAYDPVRMTAYAAAAFGCQQVSDVVSINKDSFNGGLISKSSGTAGVTKSNAASVKISPSIGQIWKFDVVSGKVAAKATLPYPIDAGVMVSAGGLLWNADNEGKFTAYDADTLAPLWSFNLGMGMSAPPMSYSINGKQYIAVIGGGHQGVSGDTGQVNSAIVAVFAL